MNVLTILSYDRQDSLVNLIDSLHKNSIGIDKIVIYDDCSHFNIELLNLDCDFFIQKENVGAIKQRNTIISDWAYNSDNIFIIEDDAILVDYLDFNQLGNLLSKIPHIHLGRFLSHDTEHLKQESIDDTIYKVPSICTTDFIAFKSSHISSVGLYDERYKGWGYGHIEYSYRWWRLGVIPYPFMVPERFLGCFRYQTNLTAISHDTLLRQKLNNRKLFKETVFDFEHWESDMKWGWWEKAFEISRNIK
jgi:hypothetical protein